MLKVDKPFLFREEQSWFEGIEFDQGILSVQWLREPCLGLSVEYRLLSILCLCPFSNCNVSLLSTYGIVHKFYQCENVCVE